jgi:hypothetical protein
VPRAPPAAPTCQHRVAAPPPSPPPPRHPTCGPWWPGFKVRLRDKVQLGWEQRAMHRAAEAGAVAAKRQLAAALEALNGAPGAAPIGTREWPGPDAGSRPCRQGGLFGVLDRKAADVVAAKYLREGERPSPAMTAAVRAPLVHRGWRPSRGRMGPSLRTDRSSPVPLAEAMLWSQQRGRLTRQRRGRCSTRWRSMRCSSRRRRRQRRGGRR